MLGTKEHRELTVHRLTAPTFIVIPAHSANARNKLATLFILHFIEYTSYTFRCLRTVKKLPRKPIPIPITTPIGSKI